MFPWEQDLGVGLECSDGDGTWGQGSMIPWEWGLGVGPNVTVGVGSGGGARCYSRNGVMG